MEIKRDQERPPYRNPYRWKNHMTRFCIIANILTYVFLYYLQLDGLRCASSSFYSGLHSQSDNTRRESSISTDSGYLMSLPESRRDSEVETSSLSGNAYKSDTNFRREEFLDTFNSQQNVVRMHYYYYGITKTKFSYKIGIKNNGKYNTKI